MKCRIDYDNVISQAQEISNQAENLQKQITALENLQQELRGGWQGEASEAFMKKLTALHGQMVQTRKKMSRLSGTIKCCADYIRDEDRKAEENVCALPSGSAGGR